MASCTVVMRAVQSEPTKRTARQQCHGQQDELLSPLRRLARTEPNAYDHQIQGNPPRENVAITAMTLSRIPPPAYARRMNREAAVE